MITLLLSRFFIAKKFQKKSSGKCVRIFVPISHYSIFQTFPSNGQGTCHVSLHAEYGLLHVSNYVGGSFTSLRVDKSSGEILGEVYNEYFGDGSHVDPDRQEASHAHGTFTIGPFIYVVDLGADKIWHFKVRCFM